jgi:cytidylate kinase
MLKSEIIDSNRANSPLIKAENAIEIDNSNLTRDEQFEMV